MILIISCLLSFAAGGVACYLLVLPSDWALRYQRARNYALRSKCERLELENDDLGELHERLLQHVRAHTALDVAKQSQGEARSSAALEWRDERESARAKAWRQA